jgi:hypothetical protein
MFSRDKHSSLFCTSTNDEEKKAFKINTCSQFDQTFITDKAKYTRLFLPGKPFQPSLICVSKARACQPFQVYPSWAGFSGRYQELYSEHLQMLRIN